MNEFSPLFVIASESLHAPRYRCRGCQRFTTLHPNGQVAAFPGHHAKYCPAYQEKRVEYINGKWFLRGDAAPLIP